jgi:hypothetical protein
MNAHKRHGYSHSDVIDYRIARRAQPAFRSGVVSYLERAASYRHEIANVTPAGRDRNGWLTDSTPETCKIWARYYIARAREWRIETLEHRLMYHDKASRAAIANRQFSLADIHNEAYTRTLREMVRAAG